jgi:hypothetical protein
MDFWPHETIASYWYFFETQQSQNNIMAFFRNVKGLAFHSTGIHPIEYKLVSLTFYSYLWNKTHNAVQRGHNASGT